MNTELIFNLIPIVGIIAGGTIIGMSFITQRRK